MKGYNYKRPDGKLADCAPCRFCKHKKKMTVESPCYNCISTVDLALHKPNVETEFAYFEPESQKALEELLMFQVAKET